MLSQQIDRDEKPLPTGLTRHKTKSWFMVSFAQAKSANGSVQFCFAQLDKSCQKTKMTFDLHLLSKNVEADFRLFLRSTIQCFPNILVFGQLFRLAKIPAAVTA